MDTGVPPIERGATWYGGDTPDVSSSYANVTGQHLEGSVRVFPNVDPTNNINRRNGGDVTCMLVRNTSGVTLLPKRLVCWAAGGHGKRIGGYCRLDADEVAGVVDEFLPAGGVQDGDLFWITTRGQTLCKTSLANYASDIAQGDALAALTAVASALTGGNTGGGRLTFALTTATSQQTTDGTLPKHTRNWFGRAATTIVTNNTNADVLVNVRLH